LVVIVISQHIRSEAGKAQSSTCPEKMESNSKKFHKPCWPIVVDVEFRLEAMRNAMT